MASYNKVVLIGNLTRDPELRYTPKGTAVAKFGLAINRQWRDEAGNTKEEVTFVDIDVFGRTAENVSQYMRKGSPIFIEGRLRLDTWEDKQTQQKRSKLGVVADVVQFLGTANKEQDGNADNKLQGIAIPKTHIKEKKSAPVDDNPPREPYENDIPF